MKIQTVLTKKAGHDVPVELLAAIINRPISAFGFAVQDGSSNKPELAIMRESGKPSMAQLNEFQRNAHAFNAMLWFGELGSKFNKEDCGPLSIEDGDNKPFICLGIEGDFAKYADPASGRTDEYNYATKILIPSLIDILNVTNGDWDKIVDRINSDRFNNSDILPHITHRGVVSFFPLIGDPIWLGKNDLGETYDWGQVSNRHGYGDVKQEPEKPKEEAKKGFTFAGMFSSKKEDTPAPTASKPKASVPEVRSDGKNLPQPIKLPDWVHKNDDKRTWYAMVGGGLVDRWKNGVPVIPVIPLDQLPKDLADLRLWEANRLKEELRSGKAVTSAAAEPVHKPASTETSAGAPKTGGEIAAQRAEEDVNRPIINAKDMEKVLNFVAGIDTKETMKVSEMIDLEKKLGDFSESVGLKPEEMLNWPVSALFGLAKADHRAIVLMAIEFRKLWRNTLKLGDIVATGSAVTKTTAIGDTGKRVESISTTHQLAKQELKPEKTGGFSFGKKVA